MSAKSGSPLNNPTLEKATAAATYPCPYCKWVGKAVAALEYHTNRYHEEAVAAAGGKMQEGGEKASRLSTAEPQRKEMTVIDMFLKCPRCRHAQHEYIYSLNDKKWIKCNECQELSASGAWTVIYVGNVVGVRGL